MKRLYEVGNTILLFKEVMLCLSKVTQVKFWICAQVAVLWTYYVLGVPWVLSMCL